MSPTRSWPGSPKPVLTFDALGAQLLDEGAKSFGKSWKDLMECIASKSKTLKAA